MVKALSVLAAVISIGVAAAIESEFWPIDDSTKAAHGLINGMILGSNLWYSNPSLASAYTNSMLIMWPQAAALDRSLNEASED